MKFKLRNLLKRGPKTKRLNTIDDLLKSRQPNPIGTTELMKDIARRIKRLERKLGV